MLSDPSNIPLCILLIAVLIMLNGIVVTCDTALNTVSRSKVKTLASEHKNKSAERLYKLLDQPFKYRYSNRILNYVFLISGIYFTTQLPYNDFICLAVYFAVAAALGELFPRKLAQHHSMKFALSFSGIQKFMVIILTPLVLILNVIADIFLLMFRQSTKVDEEGFSEDQVMEMLEVGQESGEIKEEGKNMINSIFAFDDELAYEIMTPRTDVFLIDISDPPEEYMDQLMVADVRAETPTAAAQMAVPDTAQLMDRLDEFRENLTVQLTNKLMYLSLFTGNLKSELDSQITARITSLENEIERSRLSLEANDPQKIMMSALSI